jgi:hypothetical protein
MFWKLLNNGGWGSEGRGWIDQSKIYSHWVYIYINKLLRTFTLELIMKDSVGSQQVYQISCPSEFGMQKGASIVMPNKLHAWVGTALATEVGKMQYNMFMFRAKLSQVPPIPENYNAMPPPLRTASPPCVATVYNKHTGGWGGWCVSIWVPSLPGLSFMCVWSSVCCLFWPLPSPPVKVYRTSSCGAQKDSTVK